MKPGWYYFSFLPCAFQHCVLKGLVEAVTLATSPQPSLSWDFGHLVTFRIKGRVCSFFVSAGTG